MKTKLTRIGNSRGVRLPKAIIEQVGIEDEIEMEVRRGEIAIRPANKKKPREGWAEAFKAMAAAGDDAMLDD
jgi:antitoxin MazE